MGKVQHGTNPGPAGYLSSVEEELVHFLIHTAEIGFPHTLAQLLGLVQQVVDEKN